ncbi:unnamed protein product [Symbiodinium sp. CCMP2592]|nr:unnamed protein product [Symbiodinium sp. CCMP2592]
MFDCHVPDKVSVELAMVVLRGQEVAGKMEVKVTGENSYVRDEDVAMAVDLLYDQSQAVQELPPPRESPGQDATAAACQKSFVQAVADTICCLQGGTCCWMRNR